MISQNIQFLETSISFWVALIFITSSFQSCHFETFSRFSLRFSELPFWKFWLQNAMLAFDWMKARSKNDFDWRISLSCDIENWNWGHSVHSQIAQAFKETCFLGWGNVISLLLEFGIPSIISLRQNQVWQVWTFTRACRSATKLDWKTLGNDFLLLLLLLLNFQFQLSVEN